MYFCKARRGNGNGGHVNGFHKGKMLNEHIPNNANGDNDL